MIKPVRKAVFPVAGLGTRSLPATKAVPKEMLCVVDKPVIQYAVQAAAAAGIEQFIFVTSRGKSALEDHFDSNFLAVREVAPELTTRYGILAVGEDDGNVAAVTGLVENRRPKKSRQTYRSSATISCSPRCSAISFARKSAPAARFS